MGLDAQVSYSGQQTNAASISIMGVGNAITNNGMINNFSSDPLPGANPSASSSPTIWFRNATGAGSNTIINMEDGVITAGSQSFPLFGYSGLTTNPLNFTNMGAVFGNMQLGDGNDVLNIYTGSHILADSVDGGSGDNNTLTLNGSGTETQVWEYTKFQTLIKYGSGTWILDGALTDVTHLSIFDGTLILNGNNTLNDGVQMTWGALEIGDASHNTASLSLDSDLHLPASTILGGYGTVNGNVVNAGTIKVGNVFTGFYYDTASSFQKGSVGNFQLNGHLTNQGLVQLAGAGVGNTLTVNGSYTGG